MRVLLDTHALIWAVDAPDKLSDTARTVLENSMNDILLSAATIWEIAIKVELKKLALSSPYSEWMNQALADLGATLLPITVEYAAIQSSLPNHHRDPFDRLIIAQAMSEQIAVVCADSAFDNYGVLRLW